MDLNGDIIYIGNFLDKRIIMIKNYMTKINSNKKLYIYDNFNNKKYNEILQYFKNLNLLDSNLVLIKGELKEVGLYFFPKKISYLYINKNEYDALNLFYYKISSDGYLYINENLINETGLLKFLIENNINNKFKKINNYYFIQKSKNFIESPKNNWTTFANFNSNLRYIFKNDIISSVILNNTFYYYNANKDLITKTNEIKSKLENINIIWGFKLNNFNLNFNRRWEYYVYAWNPIDDKNIYEKIKNTDLYFSDYKFETLLETFCDNQNLNYNNCKISFDNFFEKNKVHAIGFDMFENKNTCKTINLYTYQETAETNIFPIKTFGYSMNLENYNIEFTSNIITHRVNDNTFKNFITEFANNYKCKINDIFVEKYYLSSEYVALIEKLKSNELGIYYHCMDVDSFIHFLKKYNYKNDFINHVTYNKNRFSSFSFEIAINYKIIDGDIKNVRTAFYGVI